MKRIYRTILSCLVLFMMICMPKSLQSNQKAEKGIRYYNDDNIEMYGQRIMTRGKLKLKQIKLQLYSSKANSHCRLRLFGNEGGGMHPENERDIIKPIEIIKDSIGVSAIYVRINEEAIIDYGQYFICIDSISEGMNWVSNEIEYKPSCESESGDYYKQVLKIRNGKWLNGKYSFRYKCEYDTIKNDPTNYFKRIELEEIEPNDTIRNGTLNIIDYNNDKENDIIVDNKLYRNLGNLTFQEIPQISKLNKSSQLTISYDINNDGKNEILFIGEIDSVKNILSIKEYLCTGDEIKYLKNYEIEGLEESKDFIVVDINNDGYKDIILIQSDSSKEKYILLKNENGSLVKSTEFYKKYVENNEQTSSIFIVDINGDNLQDILLTSNSQEIRVLKNEGDYVFNQIRGKDINLEIDGTKLRNIINKENGYIVLTEIKETENLPELAYIINKISSNNENIFSRYNIEDKETEVKIADINNDGLADIIMTSSDRCHKSHLFLGQSDKSYKYIGYNSGVYYNNFPQGFLVADMNSDGQLDLISYEEGRVVIYKNSYETCQTKNNYLIVNDATNQLSYLTIKSEGLEYKYSQTVQRSSKMLYNGPIIVGIGSVKYIDTVEVGFNNGYQNSYLYPSSNEINIEKIDKTVAASGLRVEMYPNPFKQGIEIIVSLNKGEEISLKILNIDGQERYRTKIIGEKGENTIKWDGHDSSGNLIENGVYIIEVQNGESKYINKLIKID